MTEVDLFWDSNIKEFEVDPSWKEHEIYKSSQYMNIEQNGVR